MSKKEQGNKKRYTVKILGEEMIVVGNKSEEYIDQLVNYINKIGNEILEVYPSLPRRRLIGLAMINMADEYFKLHKKYREQRKKADSLEAENKELKEELKKLKADNEELLSLLEEVEQ